MKDLQIIVLLLLVGLLMGCQTNVPKETQTESSMEQTSEAVKEIVPFEIPEEMKVYEYEGENFLGLRATYVMPGFFACKFTTDKAFAQEYDEKTYVTYGFIGAGDEITPYSSETVMLEEYIYVIIRHDDKTKLPGIYFESQEGINFSIRSLNETCIRMTEIIDKGDAEYHFITVEQKYESELGKWGEAEKNDSPIKIKRNLD